MGVMAAHCQGGCYDQARCLEEQEISDTHYPAQECLTLKDDRRSR